MIQQDSGLCSDKVQSAGGLWLPEERPHYQIEWGIKRYMSDDTFRMGQAYSESTIHGNLLLNTGIQLLEDRLIGATATAFSNANASIGVGDGGPTNATGTFTFTNSSTTLTGSSSTLGTDVNNGDWLIGPDGLMYQLLTHSSTTAGVLASAFTGTTTSGFTTPFILREIATQTALIAGTNKAYAEMASTFPSRASQTVTFQAVFASGVANYPWREFSLNNATDGSGTTLNRKISYQGVKASGQTWTTSATLIFS